MSSYYNGQQPQATAAMSVGGGNRNAKNMPVDNDGTREWSTGLFDCLNDPETFIWSYFCPCIVYSKNKQRYDHLNTKGTADPEHGGAELVNNDCLTYAALNCFGVGFFFKFMQRGEIRGRYTIKGDPIIDVATAFCCTPCALTQEHQELELEERSLQDKA